ncbi:MAG: error-prone DNA polymerase [Actinomycetaceae bacterium]|nr:error-prone DNA polymerase [Actinomycetaceae bacterium]
MSVPYAELHAYSAYSFLHGADLPADMVRTAASLNLSGIALLDRGGMYGAVQTATAGREYGIATVYGALLQLEDRTQLPVLATEVDGYHDLCNLLSEAQLGKQQRHETLLTLDQIEHADRGNWIVLTGNSTGPLRRHLETSGQRGASRFLNELTGRFSSERVVVESCLETPGEQNDLAQTLHDLARGHGLPLAATTGARAATASSLHRAHLLRAIEANATFEQVAPYLEAIPPMLRSDAQMRAIHHRYPQAVDTAGELAAQCAFDFRLIAPQLPACDTPEGYDEAKWLRVCTYRGALRRYGTRAQYPQAWQTIDKELNLIVELGFAGYFLIVKEIVDFCRQENILCQGRGSAANSAVCFALGITAVDAVRHRMLFERFLSPGRTGPPDIDIDIEAVRREEVISHIYKRYGRRNAAQVANVITYRPRSALRDTARSCGFPEEVIGQWTRRTHPTPPDPTVVSLSQQLTHLPRHLGIHSGGMVLTRQPVSSLCPVQWASKAGRTVLQWDKEDCAEAGLVKFDLLGLGMLTALRYMFTSLENAGHTHPDGSPYEMGNIPPEDPKVYDLLCAADTVGIFQVESRAQMNTLPRMRPRCFYDLVIEVALVRPGPIHGQAVNPYLRRRLGAEPVTYTHPLLEPILRRTLGVAIFQEQLLAIAIDVAGFDAGKADRLRKAMSSKRSNERMAQLRPDFYAGLAKQGITGEKADTIYGFLKGFAQFGFPESHAFSFANLVYASAWMKVHFPEEFYAAILAAQPMGFYSPASLVQDARRHGVQVLRADVNFSTHKANVQNLDEPHALTPLKRVTPLSVDTRKAVRLGLDSIRDLSKATIDRVVQARQNGAFSSLEDLVNRVGLSSHEIELLARAGACESLALNRRSAMWQARLLGTTLKQPALPGIDWPSPPQLPSLEGEEETNLDYRATGLSVGKHPLQWRRPQLTAQGVLTCQAVDAPKNGQRVRVAGWITHRQRPHTAKGTVFLSVEDETGLVNVICTPGMWKHFRQTALSNAVVVVRGVVQCQDGVCQLLADKISKYEAVAAPRSRDFR